jgi:competence protein ComEA
MRPVSATLGSFVMAMLLLTSASLGAASQQEKPAGSRAASAAPAAPVNLNTATQAQLETLPGIGAATAKRILEYRQKSGGFKKIEELMNVKGIGEKSFLKLKPHVTVAGEKAPQGEKQ